MRKRDGISKPCNDVTFKIIDMPEDNGTYIIDHAAEDSDSDTSSNSGDAEDFISMQNFNSEMSYEPFPSALHAHLFMLLNSPRPIVCIMQKNFNIFRL